MPVRLPLVEAVHLVEGNDERRLLVLQKVDRLYRLQSYNPDSATNFEYQMLTQVLTQHGVAVVL